MARPSDWPMLQRGQQISEIRFDTGLSKKYRVLKNPNVCKHSALTWYSHSTSSRS